MRRPEVSADPEDTTAAASEPAPTTCTDTAPAPPLSRAPSHRDQAGNVLFPGDRVEARFRGKGTRYYPGVITSASISSPGVTSEGGAAAAVAVFGIAYDDGDAEGGASGRDMRLIMRGQGQPVESAQPAEVLAPQSISTSSTAAHTTSQVVLGQPVRLWHGGIPRTLLAAEGTTATSPAASVAADGIGPGPSLADSTGISEELDDHEEEDSGSDVSGGSGRGRSYQTRGGVNVSELPSVSDDSGGSLSSPSRGFAADVGGDDDDDQCSEAGGSHVSSPDGSCNTGQRSTSAPSSRASEGARPRRLSVDQLLYGSGAGSRRPSTTAGTGSNKRSHDDDSSQTASSSPASRRQPSSRRHSRIDAAFHNSTASASASAAAGAAMVTLHPGSAVQVFDRHGSSCWAPATVTRISKDCLLSVRYEDGRFDFGVDPARVRPDQ